MNLRSLFNVIVMNVCREYIGRPKTVANELGIRNEIYHMTKPLLADFDYKPEMILVDIVNETVGMDKSFFSKSNRRIYARKFRKLDCGCIVRCHAEVD